MKLNLKFFLVFLIFFNFFKIFTKKFFLENNVDAKNFLRILNEKKVFAKKLIFEYKKIIKRKKEKNKNEKLCLDIKKRLKFGDLKLEKLIQKKREKNFLIKLKFSKELSRENLKLLGIKSSNELKKFYDRIEIDYGNFETGEIDPILIENFDKINYLKKLEEEIKLNYAKIHELEKFQKYLRKNISRL